MLRLFLLFSVLLMVSPSSGFTLEISFAPSAEVTSSFVTLGDIATFDEDSPLAIALSSKHIGHAPKPGKSASLNTGTIRTKLQNELSKDEPLHFKGASATSVLRKGITIGPHEIETTITDFLKEQKVDLPVADYSFVPRELPLPFVLPTGQLEIDIIPANPEIIGSRRFSLIYRIDGKVKKNISIRGKLEALATVAILTQNVKRGTILYPDMVKLQTKDLSKLRSPCTDLRQVLGKKLTRSLRSGSVLDLSSIDFPPLIQKGQLVKILINHNGLQLTATGIASMNGKQDQIIRVMNSGSQKTILCKVAAPGLVEVQI